MAENQKNVSMNIIVDDGSHRVPICNTRGEEIGTFTFHPTDIGIIQRYNSLADDFDSITAPLEAVESPEDGNIDISNPNYVMALREAETRMCKAVDTLFGSDGASAAFFGNMHPFSPVDGEFYCTRVLNAVGAYIGAQFEAETARFSDRAKKYLKKAGKK